MRSQSNNDSVLPDAFSTRTVVAVISKFFFSFISYLIIVATIKRDITTRSPSVSSNAQTLPLVQFS